MKRKILLSGCSFFMTTVFGMHMGSQEYLNGYSDGRKFIISTLQSLEKECTQINNNEEFKKFFESLDQSKDPLKKHLNRFIQTAIVKKLQAK